MNVFFPETDSETDYLRPCSEIIVGQELEELKVTICDVSLEPRLVLSNTSLLPRRGR